MEEAPEPKRLAWWGRRSRRARIAILAIALLVALGNAVRMPYYSLGPGPATDVLAALTVRDAEDFPSAGKLLLTTASISGRTLTVFEYLWTFVDTNLDVVPERAILPPGRSDAEQQAANLRAMEASKLNAERAAFDALGRPVRQLAAARVLDLLPGAAATGKLERGDLITAIGSIATPDAEAVVSAVQGRRPGVKVRVRFERAGRSRVVPITLGSNREDGAASLGVSIIDAFRFPVDVSIDTRRIGGPSGGLVFALAIVDALTEEDLTRGHTIAVTGTIGFTDGVATVGPIGAIEEKIRGAAGVGADLFILPEADAARARAVAPAGMRIEAVKDLAEALAVLRSLEPKLEGS